MDIYNTGQPPQQRRGTGKSKTVSRQSKRKFKIPEKGRIRLVLILAVIIIAVVKFAGPCVSSNDSGDDLPRNLPPAAPDDKKNDNQMTFADLRQLIKNHDIGINASEQIVVMENANIEKRSKSKDRDTIPDTLTLSLSIDTSLQKYANRLFNRYKPRYAAAAAIDPATGRVLALASYAGEGEEMDGSDLYLKSVFPAASVFKTIVAAAGIERGGMTSKTMIPHYGRNHTLYKTQLEKDLKVSRDISLQDAFAYSINPAFARIALFNVNKDVVIDYGKRFGFNDVFPFEYDADTSIMLSPDSDFSVAEFASGFNRQTSISPLFGALLAGAVCQNGVIYEPTIVDNIHSSKRDTVVYNRKPQIWRRAVKEQTANELRWLMTKVTHYGTGRTAFRPLRDSPRWGKYEFGGKTGNVNKLGLGRVDWYVGFARDPNNKNRQIAVGVVTTHGEYWTVQSSYIASELLKKYIAGEEQKARAATSLKSESLSSFEDGAQDIPLSNAEELLKIPTSTNYVQNVEMILAGGARGIEITAIPNPSIDLTDGATRRQIYSYSTSK